MKEKSWVVLPREIKHQKIYFVIGSVTRKECKPAVWDAGDDINQPLRSSSADSLGPPPLLSHWQSQGEVFSIHLDSHFPPAPVEVTVR